MFMIEDAEKAYEIYDSISREKYFQDTEQRIQIYFLKPGKFTSLSVKIICFWLLC